MDIINYSHQQNNDKENQSKQISKLTFLRHAGEKNANIGHKLLFWNKPMECYQNLLNQ